MSNGGQLAMLGATLLLASTITMRHAEAGALDMSGDLRLVSDYVFRGVSQTMSRPALQGTLAIENESGWYAYGWASSVDFTESGAESDGASIEVDVALGYTRALGERVSLTIEHTNYFFPGTYDGADYDYAEWLGYLTLDEAHTLTVGYSADTVGSGEPGVFYAIGSYIELSERVGIELELAHYDLERAFGAAYSYGEVALAGEVRSFDWRLSYLMTAGPADQLFPASTVSDRFVLEVGIGF